MKQARSIDQDFRVCAIYLVTRIADDTVIYVGASLNVKIRKHGVYDFGRYYAAGELRWVEIEMCVAEEQAEREQFWLDVMRMLRHPVANRATPRKLHTNAINNRKIWKKTK